MINLAQLFYVDRLSLVLIGLVSFVAIFILSFASRYLKGDRGRFNFYNYLTILVLAVFVMVCSDHLLLLFLPCFVPDQRCSDED